VSRSLKAHLLLVLVTFAWGATFVAIKNALVDVSPLVFNALRMATASVALVAVFWRELKTLGETRLDKNADGTPLSASESPIMGQAGLTLGGTLLGVFLWAGYWFQTVGLKYTTASKSAFITGMAVVLVPLIVAVSGRRVPNRWTMLGVAGAFVGLYLLTIGSNNLIGTNYPTQAKSRLEWGTRSSNLRPINSLSPNSVIVGDINRGDVLTLGSAISFAFYIYTLGRMMERMPFKPIAVVQVLAATVLMTATIPLEKPRLVFTAEAVFAILFTGLICTAAAYSIQAWAQQFTPPTHTALIFVLEPVFAALTSYVLLGEHLGVRGTIGAILILGGILVSELKGSSVEQLPSSSQKQA
jgi:drug/metabolite transporter (DMT)-like permease